MLSTAGFLDWEIISKLDEPTRKYIRGNLRKEGVTSIRLILTNEIFNRYENEKPRKRDPPGEKPRRELSLKSLLSPLRCAVGRPI